MPAQHATTEITTDALRHLRKSRGWSLADMAKAIGAVKPRTIEHWMQGRRPHPAYHEKLKSLLKIMVNAESKLSELRQEYERLKK